MKNAESITMGILDVFILFLLQDASEKPPPTPPPTPPYYLKYIRLGPELYFPNGMRWSEIRDYVHFNQKQIWPVPYPYSKETIGKFVWKSLQKLCAAGCVEKYPYRINSSKRNKIKKFLEKALEKVRVVEIAMPITWKEYRESAERMLYDDYKADRGLDDE